MASSPTKPFGFSLRSNARDQKTLDVETAPEWFHEGQRKAWKSEVLNVVIVAGAQGGKTAIQARWLLRELKRCAPLIKELGRGVGLYVGPTLKLLRQQAIPALKVLLEEELQLGKYLESPNARFQFSPEGAKRVLGFETDLVILFAYAEDSSNLESTTAVCAVWDEAGQKGNKLASLEALERRLSIARGQGKRDFGIEMGRVMWGSTPYIWNFFKTHIHDLAEKGNRHRQLLRLQETRDLSDHERDELATTLPGLGYELINFATWMNPRQSREVIEAKKATMPLERWEMMHLGKFTKPAGMVYDCFDPDLHVIPFQKIPKAWPRFYGLDFGPIHTACVMLAQELRKTEDGWGEPTGVYIQYREYRTSTKTDTETNVKAILHGESQLPAVCRGGASTEDGWRGDFRGKGLSVGEPILSGPGSVEAGIARVYTLLSTGRLRILETCHMTIEEMGLYSREVDDDATPLEKIDKQSTYHLMDALRYIAPNLKEGPNRVDTPRDIPKAAYSLV